MNISETKVFFDNNIIEYLYQILEKGIESAAPTVDINERKAILKIWDNCTIVTTSGLYQEVEQGINSEQVKHKVKEKIHLLDGLERKSSTAIRYGEGFCGEGRYEMPELYNEILALFKSKSAENEKRDAQHILNCYDNKINYLITLDNKDNKGLLTVGKSPTIKDLGIVVLKPSEFMAKFL